MKTLIFGLIALYSSASFADITNPSDSKKLTIQIEKNLPKIVKLAKTKGYHFSINPSEMTVNCIGTESFYYHDQVVGTCVVDDEMSLWTITVADSKTGPQYSFDRITSEQ
jgi:hypothetical protein